MTDLRHAPGVATDLLAWFDSRERDVPWRDEKDPYRIWVAEVMAQQTRMETVGRYYETFIDRFPTTDALAAADIDDVLLVWQGLGYYSRARNLHRAAGQIVERHGGQVPPDVDALRALSGVGPYTAGAVASMAFGIAEPAVDGNARRVFSRLFDIADPKPAVLDRVARAVVEAGSDRPAAINQAVMDLGGSLCSPRNPSCDVCPLSAVCLALANGTVADRPPRLAKTPTPSRTAAASVVWRGAEVLFVRRPESGLLGGLWDLPGTPPVADSEPRVGATGLALFLEDRFGVRVAHEDEPLTTVSHVFSHFRLELSIWEAHVRPSVGSQESAEAVEVSGKDQPYRWIAPTRFGELAVPTYLRSVLPMLVKRSKAAA